MNRIAVLAMLVGASFRTLGGGARIAQRIFDWLERRQRLSWLHTKIGEAARTG